MRSETVQARATLKQALRSLQPPPALSVATWAAENRLLGTSSPLPGRWNNATLPFLVEPMNAMSPDDPAELVILQKCSQIGGSEILLNVLAYYVAHAPAPILVALPSIEAMKKFSRHRIEPLIASTPALSSIVRDSRVKGSHNTILMKNSLNGAVVVMTGANSSVGLRSTPVKILLCDEIDCWGPDASGEGDPFSLALRRTDAFSSQRKVLAVSSPTIEGFSRVESLYNESDMRRYYVPCVACGHMQILEWSQLRWTKDQPETAHYVCIACGHKILNHQKSEMLARGEWRPTGRPNQKVRGYHLSQLYGPAGWPTWPDLAAQWLQAQSSKEVLQTFVNCSLGQTWRDEGSVPLDSDILFARREPFAAEVPMGACLLTAGCDVQADRVEVEVVGWGRGEESWSIAYVQLWGDPGEATVWQELDRLLLRSYRHESGFDLHISAACVDAGFMSSEVVEYCRTRMARRIYATKGQSGFSKPIWPRKVGGRHATGSRQTVFMIAVDVCKERVHSKLKIDAPGPGDCHWPLSRDKAYFEQLCSERIVTRYINGRPQRTWAKSPSVRNECLDARVYATAALFSLFMSGVDLNRHASEFEAMCSPATADRPAQQSGYTVVRSKWMS